ncbi:MAG TPA: hypothetical protein VK819_09555 [Acidobacteriaceae bacterium]|jgi:hypothetical protein|nr:hypothetical protein [Acidobacteriaceae bacterium]
MPATKSTVPARLILSLVLGGVTVAAIKLASVNLAWSTMLNEVTNWMMTPGETIERMFITAPQPWDTPFILVTAGVYFVVWFIILAMVWSTRSGTNRVR